jgi:repressor LexA
MVKEMKQSRRANSELSLRQQNILNYIQNFIHKNSYSPSIRDIQMNLHISSTSVVAYNLKALEEKGKLERQDKISRGIKLIGNNVSSTNASVPKTIQVPLLGMITAGNPLPNPEDTTSSERELVDVPIEMIPSSKVHDTYALRVRGRSMIDALIDDGDIVIIHYQETAENGDMVAAWMTDDNAVTLKKFYHESGKIRLQPANVTMQPTFTTPDKVQIRGRVIGVLRHLI